VVGALLRFASSRKASSIGVYSVQRCRASSSCASSKTPTTRGDWTLQRAARVTSATPWRLVWVRAITRAIPRIVRVSSKRRNSVARELLVSLAPGDQALFYGEVVDRHREMGRVQVRLEQAPRRALVELGRQLTNLLDGVLHELFKKDVHSALRVGMVERCWKWLGGLRLFR
jgi:hypothetical protein